MSDTQARLDATGGEVWHVIEGEDIRDLLRRAHAGEDPELLYIEAYVNAEKGDVDADQSTE
jgi:hypothetical protein